MYFDFEALERWRPWVKWAEDMALLAIIFLLVYCWIILFLSADKQR
jgi:hypothetical protein